MDERKEVKLNETAQQTYELHSTHHDDSETIIRLQHPDWSARTTTAVTADTTTQRGGDEHKGHTYRGCHDEREPEHENLLKIAARHLHTVSHRHAQGHMSQRGE